MNKAKNGSKKTDSGKKSSKENDIHHLNNSTTTKESSTQTDDIDDVTKNYKRAFLIKKREKFESLVSKYVPIIYLMFISFYLYK